MPFRRVLPALMPALVFLVGGTAQRLVLLWLAQEAARPTARDAAMALAHGVRLDLATLLAHATVDSEAK